MSIATAKREQDFQVFGCPRELQWRLVWIRLRASCYRAIPQIQDRRLSGRIVVPVTEQSPACDSGDQENAGSHRKQRSAAVALRGFSELRKIVIAEAVGAEVVEPRLRFQKRHLTRGDFLENLGAWTPDTFGIRELLAQTTA